MKILIECYKKHANEVASTIFSNLFPIISFDINRKGYDLVVDMRDCKRGIGQVLNTDETVKLCNGKFAVVKKPVPELPKFGGIDLWDPPEFT